MTGFFVELSVLLSNYLNASPAIKSSQAQSKNDGVVSHKESRYNCFKVVEPCRCYHFSSAFIVRKRHGKTGYRFLIKSFKEPTAGGHSVGSLLQERHLTVQSHWHIYFGSLVTDPEAWCTDAGAPYEQLGEKVKDALCLI